MPSEMPELVVASKEENTAISGDKMIKELKHRLHKTQ